MTQGKPRKPTAVPSLSIPSPLSPIGPRSPGPKSSSSKPGSAHPPRKPTQSTFKTLWFNKSASFLVKLTIHEITNVPLVSGSLSATWKFRGSKGGLETKVNHDNQESTDDVAVPCFSPLEHTFTGALNRHNATSTPTPAAGLSPSLSRSGSFTTGSSTPQSAATAASPKNTRTLTKSPESFTRGLPSAHPSSTTSTSHPHQLSQVTTNYSSDSASEHEDSHQHGEKHPDEDDRLRALIDGEIVDQLDTLPGNVREPHGATISAASRKERIMNVIPGAGDGRASLKSKASFVKSHLHLPHIVLPHNESMMLLGALGKRPQSTASSSGNPSRRGSISSDQAGALQNNPQVSVKIAVPIGTVTDARGRTSVKEVENHSATWDWHVAQLVKIKIRPLEEPDLAVRIAQDIEWVNTIGGSTTPKSQKESTEPEHKGYLGGGPKSESGLKIVVFQHPSEKATHLDSLHSVTSNDSSPDATSDPTSIGAKIEEAAVAKEEAKSASKSSGGGSANPFHILKDRGIFFGELNLDLAEFVNEQAQMGHGSVARRYLLKGGKTNAMIKLSVEMVQTSGDTDYYAPELPKGHDVSGLTERLHGADTPVEHHLEKLKALPGSESTLSLSAGSSNPSGQADVSFTGHNSRGRPRPRKPPDSHFIDHDDSKSLQGSHRGHGHGSFGQQAVYNAVKDAHKSTQHHNMGTHSSGQYTAEHVIELIFSPHPVSSMEHLTPFSYLDPHAEKRAEHSSHRPRYGADEHSERHTDYAHSQQQPQHSTEHGAWRKKKRFSKFCHTPTTEAEPLYT